jgi:hypothetical protein
MPSTASSPLTSSRTGDARSAIGAQTAGFDAARPYVSLRKTAIVDLT